MTETIYLKSKIQQTLLLIEMISPEIKMRSAVTTSYTFLSRVKTILRLLSGFNLEKL
jgi:hypothetical protein